MSSSLQYTCEIIIHRASRVPIADINTFSSDPYILACLQVGSNEEDLRIRTLTYRTHTVRQNLDPVFNNKWIVSGIPASGFMLTLHLRDEDRGKCHSDDKLGAAVLNIPGNGAQLTEGFVSQEREYKVEKRKGDVTNHITTWFAELVMRGKLRRHTRVSISARVVGKPRGRKEEHQKIYTVGPHTFVRHSSPIIGRMVGASKSDTGPIGSSDITKTSPKKLKTTSFIANRLQLTGPVPPSLKHRYVGYRPFIESMFKRNGIKGRFLNRGLHHQYNTIYKYSKSTTVGIIEDNPEDEGTAFAKQFLHMTSYGTAGRLFTYIITLDGEMRFTETGEEFCIAMLSKHSMHADVAKELSFSGEFFVRKCGQTETDDEEDHDADENERDEDPGGYELVIDNDSGTYRPNKDLLPTLEKWLAGKDNFGGLGKVTTMDGFDKTLKMWKEEMKQRKRRTKSPRIRYKGRIRTNTTGRAAAMMTPESKGSPISEVSVGKLVANVGIVEELKEDEKTARESREDDVSPE